MKNRSLKQQLFRSLAIPIIAALFIIGLISFAVIYHEIGAAHDLELKNVADILWILTEDEINEEPDVDKLSTTISQKDIHQLAKYKDWLSFRIWKENQLVTSSLNAWPPSVKPSKINYSNVHYKGKRWRTYTLYVPKYDVIIEVASDYSERIELAFYVLLGLVIPLLFSFPIIAYLIHRGINNGLLKLKKVTKQIQKLTPTNLTTLSTIDVPPDLLPLTEAVNNLMVKLEDSLEHERQFTDNAVHELRTPLAVVKAQAQVITLLQTEEERSKAVSNLVLGVDGLTRIVEQLLILSRLHSHDITLKPIPLSAVVRQVASEMAPMALSKNIDISFTGDESPLILAQEDLLQILIRNLLDNAIKYTDKGSIKLHVKTQDEFAIFEIIDSGPGIPVEEHAKVFDRFYRRLGSSVAGSGLGLSIVKKIADLFHAKVLFEESKSEPGLCVNVWFPLKKV